MHVTRYPIDRIPGNVVDRWNALLEKSPVRSAFLSYDFCHTVQSVFGGVYVVHLEAEGEGFLPIQMPSWRSAVGHARKVGGTMSDHFGIVGDVKGPLSGTALLSAAGVSVLRFDHGIPEQCTFDFSDREATRGTKVCVDGYADFMANLAAKNPSFVKLVQRRERQIPAEIGALQFRWHSADVADLANLIDVKRQQYARTNVRDGLKSEKARRLLGQLLAADSSPRSRAVLSTLHAGGKWLASNLSLLCHDTLHIWYPAYNMDFGRYNPGHVLFMRMIEHGSANGVRVYDFGEGESRYKSEYRGRSYELWKGVIRLGGAAAQLERTLQSAEWRVEEMIQRVKFR